MSDHKGLQHRLNLLKHTKSALGAAMCALLVACAVPARHPSPTNQAVVVPVISVWPASDPQAQKLCPPESTAPAATDTANQTGFCVAYRLGPQDYTVWLPTHPGTELTLQVPAPSALSPVPHAYTGVPPYAPYPAYGPYPVYVPGVFYMGTYYRPRPYIPVAGPVVRPYTAGHHLARGKRR